MKEWQMAKVLKENYSLGELEERLDVAPEDLENGWSVFVDEHYDKVLEFLREDLWFDGN